MEDKPNFKEEETQASQKILRDVQFFEIWLHTPECKNRMRKYYIWILEKAGYKWRGIDVPKFSSQLWNLWQGMGWHLRLLHTDSTSLSFAELSILQQPEKRLKSVTSLIKPFYHTHMWGTCDILFFWKETCVKRRMVVSATGIMVTLSGIEWPSFSAMFFEEVLEQEGWREMGHNLWEPIYTVKTGHYR